jgi:predicted Fe-Mo cluster-binding NifX family protein
MKTIDSYYGDTTVLFGINKKSVKNRRDPMKIAFPTQQDNGLESPVYGHFGSAPYFIIVDLKSKTHESVSNQNLNHSHGNCQPLVALGGNPVDAVVVGGIGGGALMKLQAAGITTYRAAAGSISENLNLIGAGKLPEFTRDQTCIGHDHNGHCAH